ncbi:cobalt-zinc-cadmium efflux system protein [Clostridium acetobutylicum]|uniref:Co/Zn/Cd efflux system component n=1 Tax=Clostridium acetobutylicum (strain ATCC 824 / DSM 792 / JCM 1419 / IAM 19013 / LMG 5710 / NBRC 13948 / NRRL B-527 / VKM B-1787 / 2291 / W) TaxID=272562 RepID=Q97G32_CLOAB|nr:MULTISPECIES: cation diffusion facilitator family transporter [Clostridium]AAK80491.1 Co/Zn/Cd efflux system component [Clostridium acetobutylicum ATCC 824]ADZ21590.1 Co/Zn/Cd efflux system component [Clostridium acetobutylicum EA 2018]AEI33742.1 Co/Zn/Cd efflux system component [Clostridium acetobutylicum DSM 1731]AWV79091.1 cation transporter [Clostridium acetobutylicum]MBC2394948.1 cation transporter [Clostridium acetobutylicum]
MEKHSHEHHHHHDISSISKNKLFFVIIFNFIIALAEVIGGSISGSLSLISDALHNLSDTASLILSYVSIKISEKPKNKAKTYGYKRANILAAFINSAALIGISIFLGVQALEKLTSLKKINANIVIVVALIGLLGNFLSVIILKKGAEKSLNVRSSYLHMLSDAMASLAVIISGVFIKYFAIYWIDSVLTIFINMLILKSSYNILKESINILMQTTPVNLDMDDVKEQLLKIKEIKGVHHFHIWTLDENNIVLEGHIEIDDILVSETRAISDKIEHILNEDFHITHVVIQFESTSCEDNICKI